MRRTMPGRVGYVYDPLYLEHELRGHPERPDRLRAIMSHLEESGVLGQMRQVQPRDATTHELRFVHTESLIEEVAATAGVDRHRFDADTYGSARSYEAALRAAGGTLAATEAVLRGEIDSAFCFVRPPGHHATPDRSMRAGCPPLSPAADIRVRRLRRPRRRPARQHSPERARLLRDRVAGPRARSGAMRRPPRLRSRRRLRPNRNRLVRTGMRGHAARQPLRRRPARRRPGGPRAEHRPPARRN